MKLNIENYTCLEKFAPELVTELRNNYDIFIEGEALDFFKNYPSLQLEGCSLLKSPDKCHFVDGVLISDFLGLNQLVYLKKENFFDRYMYLLDELGGNIIPISLAMGENQLIIARSINGSKFKIYTLDDFTKSICYICEGIFPFINNHLDHEFTL